MGPVRAPVGPARAPAADHASPAAGRRPGQVHCEIVTGGSVSAGGLPVPKTITVVISTPAPMKTPFIAAKYFLVLNAARAL